MKVDVVDIASVQAMVDLAAKEFGRIDYCVNAAGVILTFSQGNVIGVENCMLANKMIRLMLLNMFRSTRPIPMITTVSSESTPRASSSYVEQ